MPDAQGKFKGIAVPAQAWERIFAPKPPEMTEAQKATFQMMLASMKP